MKDDQKKMDIETMIDKLSPTSFNQLIVLSQQITDYRLETQEEQFEQDIQTAVNIDQDESSSDSEVYAYDGDMPKEGVSGSQVQSNLQ